MINFAIALVLGLLLGKSLIPILTNIKFGQAIREEGPKSHLVKTGTPTMGGFIFLTAALCSLLITFEITQTSVYVMLVTLLFGLIGFLDDFLIIKRKKNDGLKSSHKLLMQILIAAPMTIFAAMTYGTAIHIPFMAVPLDLGLVYYPLTFIFIIAIDNGVNLTDGIDGLNASVTSIVMVFFIIISSMFATPDVAPVAYAMLGGLLGYLWFNKHPAKVFMGDIGSLALGGLVAALTIMHGLQLFVFIFGFIYFLETLSVVLQVASFKLRNGKRIFKMSPIHHHFELSGWSEWKIVIVFSTITLLGSALTIYLLK